MVSPEEFGQLVEEHRSRLISSARRHGAATHEDAEDAVHNAVMKIRFEDLTTAQARAALYRSTQQRAVEQTRTARYRHDVPLGPEALQIPSTRPSPEDLAVDRTLIRRAMIELDETERTIVDRSAAVFTHNEISRKLGLQGKWAITRRLRRMRERLRDFGIQG